MNTKPRYDLKEFEKEFGPLTFGEALESYRIGEEISQVVGDKGVDDQALGIGGVSGDEGGGGELQAPRFEADNPVNLLLFEQRLGFLP